jgi:hypothetical protein
MNIKPGDLIEWVYRTKNETVCKDETLWSSQEQKWVPIGSGLTHKCVFCDEKTYKWSNQRGLFRAHVDDMWSNSNVQVIPLVCD